MHILIMQQYKRCTIKIYYKDTFNGEINSSLMSDAISFLLSLNLQIISGTGHLHQLCIEIKKREV